MKQFNLHLHIRPDVQLIEQLNNKTPKSSETSQKKCQKHPDPESPPANQHCDQHCEQHCDQHCEQHCGFAITSFAPSKLKQSELKQISQASQNSPINKNTAIYVSSSAYPIGITQAINASNQPNNKNVNAPTAQTDQPQQSSQSILTPHLKLISLLQQSAQNKTLFSSGEKTQIYYSKLLQCQPELINLIPGKLKQALIYFKNKTNLKQIIYLSAPNNSLKQQKFQQLEKQLNIKIFHIYQINAADQQTIEQTSQMYPWHMTAKHLSDWNKKLQHQQQQSKQLSCHLYSKRHCELWRNYIINNNLINLLSANYVFKSQAIKKYSQQIFNKQN